MITGIAGNMESMLVEQWAYRETDEHRENLFHQQSICLAVYDTMLARYALEHFGSSKGWKLKKTQPSDIWNHIVIHKLARK